ncbi:MAG: hypothetical protein KJ908_03540, partial [Acidobacteria bacterium]|nr:hypothetical protein [Acidobacteriota bacterium]
YASFVPVREPVIDKNGTLLIYYEPQNIFTVVREGIYEIWYTQDMAVLHDKLRNASVTKMFDFEVRTP